MEAESAFCLCKEDLDPSEFQDRLRFHDLTKTGWICLMEGCTFCCSSLDEINKHGEIEFHDPLTNAVFIGEFDFNDAQEILSSAPYNEDYGFVQSMECGEALGIRCLCGKGVLALLLASTLKSPNGIHKDSEKKDSKLPTLSLNSYLKSVRKQLHMNQATTNGNSSEKKQLIDKCSVCLKVLQLYRSDSDTLATQKLRNHALTHLPKYWLCPLCDQRFQRKNDTLSHLDKKHQQSKTEPLCTITKREFDAIVEGMLNNCFPDLQTMPVNRKLIKGDEFSHKELPAGTSIADLNRPSAITAALDNHNDSPDISSLSNTSTPRFRPIAPAIPAPVRVGVPGGGTGGEIQTPPPELTACALCSKKLQLAYRGAVRHVTRMKNHALTHMDAYWMCPVCQTKMHRRSDLTNHLGRHDTDPMEEPLMPVLTIDEDEFQRMLSEMIEMCFPEGGKNTLTKEQLARIPVIDSKKYQAPKVQKKQVSGGGQKSERAKPARDPTMWPAMRERHLYAKCESCERVLKLWKNRRHGIPWTGMSNHALTHMKNYWHCKLCNNSYQRRDDAIKHAAKYHKHAKYARCSVSESKYQAIVRQTVMKCWLKVLKENPGGTQSSNFKGMVISCEGDILAPNEDRELLRELGEKIEREKREETGEEEEAPPPIPHTDTLEDNMATNGMDITQHGEREETEDMGEETPEMEGTATDGSMEGGEGEEEEETRQGDPLEESSE